MRFSIRLLLLALISLISACSNMYYGAFEAVGMPKRDIMVHYVENARTTQQETKEQFKSALEQFTALTHFKGGDLEDTYNKLNSEYEDSVDKADEVRKRIADIEDVSEALFEEWADEITEYSSDSYKRLSQQNLTATQDQYEQLIAAMKRAESKMNPVLAVFKDQVLFLKHNLNAQAIASLKGELKTVTSDVAALIQAMEKSINEADTFLSTMEN